MRRVRAGTVRPVASARTRRVVLVLGDNRGGSNDGHVGVLPEKTCWEDLVQGGAAGARGFLREAPVRGRATASDDG